MLTQSLSFFRLTVVQILMAARSVHQKRKLDRSLNESFIPILYFSDVFVHFFLLVER